MPLPKLPADESKPDEKKTLSQTIVTSMPVVLTVLATILAGLSSSEMTRAQYFRALAAQQQSKAGDQWSLFQAKKIRASVMQGTSDMLEAMGDAQTVSSAQIASMARRLEQAVGVTPTSAPASASGGALPSSAPAADPAGSSESPASAGDQVAAAPDAARARKIASQISAALADGQVAAVLAHASTARPAVPVAGDANIQTAVLDVRAHQTEEEMAATVRQISDSAMLAAIVAAQRSADDFDKANKPASDALDHLYGLVASATGLAQTYRRATANPAGEPANSARAAQAGQASALAADCERVFRDLSALRLGRNIARYNAEASFNEAIAELFEVQVRAGGAASDRHRNRSSYFFMGMLLAQAGVTIATVSLSLRRKSVLLGLAAAAGLIAVSLSAYIYLAI